MKDDEDLDYLKRDPEEEFFMLSVLALKMNHTEEFQAEYVYDISASQLFNEVKELGMPFHKWYKWLDEKFNSLKKNHEESEK